MRISREDRSFKNRERHESGVSLRLPPKARKEFVTEGDVEIGTINGVSVILIDNCYLPEFVQRHFKPVQDERGWFPIGRVQIIITPIDE